MDVGSYLITGGVTLLATLSGVVVANLFQNSRLRTQLVHDQKLKDREREMSLRRDVYLEAAEAVQAGLIVINRFPNLELSHDKVIEGYIDKAPSMAKVHIIAKEETVNAVIGFTAELNAAFLRLFAKRVSLASERHQIEVLRAQVDSSLKDNARTLELIKQYNLDGLNDQNRWNWLQQNFDFEQKQVTEARQEADSLAVTLSLKQLQYIQECADETTKLGRLVAPMVFSVRKELELPINEVGYRRVTEEAATKQAENLKDFIQELKALTAGPSAEGGAPSR
jgi:hypothetical protein